MSPRMSLYPDNSAGPHAAGSAAACATGPNTRAPVARAYTWNCSSSDTTTRAAARATATDTNAPFRGTARTAHRPASTSQTWTSRTPTRYITRPSGENPDALTASGAVV